MQTIRPTHYSRILLLLGQEIINIVHVGLLPELVVAELVNSGLLVEDVILRLVLVGILDVLEQVGGGLAGGLAVLSVRTLLVVKA